MKKIIFYINAIHDGGAERVMVNLAKYFSEEGFDTILVTSFKDTWEYPLAHTVKRLSLEEVEIKQSRIKRNLTRIKKLRALCKSEQPDILVSFMGEPNFRAILATRGLPIKTLVSVRNDPNKEYSGKLGRFIGKCLLPMADGCVFQTEEAQKWFPKRLQNKSRIIYNAVKEEFYNVPRKPVKGEIVTCGRLEKQKNHKFLINAFAEVIKEHPYATLRIYGEGKLHDELQKQIDAEHLNENAFLMGATDHVADALQTADLFVLSSDYEGMPNALMEAMAAGVPCVSTDCPCGGPRELFGTHGKEYLIRVGDNMAMSEIIKMHLRSKDICDKNRGYMRNHAEKFSPERVYKEWMDYIENIINGYGEN